MGSEPSCPQGGEEVISVALGEALAAILYRLSAIQAADSGAVVESLPDRGLSTSNIRDASKLFVCN